MRVALINTRIESRQTVPVHLLTLGAYIEDICEVQVFDPDVTNKEFCDIKEFDPDIIGITAMSQTWWRAKEIIDAFKDKRIIIGGIHATVCPEEVLAYSGVDAVCVGEGEAVLYDYILSNTVIGKLYLVKKIPNINDLPMPAYHLMPDIKKYLRAPGSMRGMVNRYGTMVILTGRGCFGRCTFCSSNAMFGRTIRKRSVEKVIDEIKYVREHYGNVNYCFMDDTFTAVPKWVRQFCKAVKPLKVDWTCQTRGDTISRRLALTMMSAGCKQLDMGVESGSDHVLKLLKKGVTRKQYLDTFEMAHSIGMRMGATFIIGTQGETEQDIEETKEFIRIAKPDLCQFFYIYPYPGSEIYKHYPLPIATDSMGCQDKPLPTNTENISTDRYIEIRNELYHMVWWRNLKGYLTFSSLIFGFKLLSINRIIIAIKTFYHKRNLYDVLYEILKDYRENI